MWNNLQNLIGLTNTIQWVSIIMIFIGGLLQVGKYFVDSQITNLKDTENLKKEKLREKTEAELNEQVDSLKIDLDESKEELTEIREKTKYVDPYTQPISPVEQL